MHHQEKRDKTGIEEMVGSCFFCGTQGTQCGVVILSCSCNIQTSKKEAQKNLYADFVVSRYCILHSFKD